MVTDREIHDVRKIRRSISASHGHDLKRLFEHYQELEREERCSGRHRFAGTVGMNALRGPGTKHSLQPEDHA